MEYSIVNHIIGKLDPSLSAAEAHGIAAGMISVNNSTNAGNWLDETFPGAVANDPDTQILLEEFFSDTYDLLVNEDYQFAVFLPDDDAPLPERLEALRHWCQGYLFGLGQGVANLQWPDEILEIIKDITELTKLDSGVDGEDAENDFMEITEYVKTGVIFVNAELNLARNSAVH